MTRATSGLAYVKGSHRWRRRFDPEDFGVKSVAATRDERNEPIPDFDANRDASEFSNWNMRPANRLVHTGLLIGLESRAPLNHGMFRVVSLNGEPIVPRPLAASSVKE